MCFQSGLCSALVGSKGAFDVLVACCCRLVPLLLVAWPWCMFDWQLLQLLLLADKRCCVLHRLVFGYAAALLLLERVQSQEG